SVFKSVEDFWGATLLSRRFKAAKVSNARPPEPLTSEEVVEPQQLPISTDIGQPQSQSLVARGRGVAAILRERLQSSRRWVLWVSMAVVVVFLVVVASYKSWNPPPPSELPFSAEPTIEVSVSGAHVIVDGEDRGVGPKTVKLGEGQHTI